VPDTIVFIPAWNEAASLPELLAEAKRDLPDADLLVIDDGSTDDTAQVALAGGAEVVSFPENRGLRHGIAEGPMSTPRRPWPRSSVAPMITISRRGTCAASRFAAARARAPRC